MKVVVFCPVVRARRRLHHVVRFVPSRRLQPETRNPRLRRDGSDLVRRFVAERKLPNIARLIEQGGLYPLETTHSPESPTAWASFATGVNAGKHNIYDFLVRDTATYLPDLGMVRREPAKFLLDWIPIQKPKIISIRGGTSFGSLPARPVSDPAS